MQTSLVSKRSSNVSNAASVSSNNKRASSYLQRYRGKKEQRDRYPFNSVSFQSTLLEDQLKNRTEKVIELCNRGQDISDIKIEDQQCESQFMRNEFLETELLWFKKIDETKHEIMQVRQLCQKESKIIRDTQKDVTERRSRLMQLAQKLQKQIKDYQLVEVETYQKEMEEMQQEYDSIQSRGEELLSHAREERDQLLAQKEEEQNEMQALQKEIESLCEYQDQAYNTRLTQLLAQQNKLHEEIAMFQEKITEAQREIRIYQTRRPIRQETHRKYLELYQKMYANKQLDKVEELVQVKHKQIGRLQDCEKKSALFQLKKMQVCQKQKKVQSLQQQLKNAQQVIREKSTKILQLYQHESQRLR